MGSPRKRARPNPPNPVATTTDTIPEPQPSEGQAGEATRPSSVSPSAADSTSVPENGSTSVAPTTVAPERKKTGGIAKQLKQKSSWYGTWPRKSIASTQVARETILADKPKNANANGNTAPSADLSRFEQKRPTLSSSRPPSMYLGKSKETLDITIGDMDGASSTKDIEATRQRKETKKPDNSTKENDANSGGDPSGAKGEAANDLTSSIPETPAPIRGSESVVRPSTASGWLGGWLSRPNLHDGAGNLAKPANKPEVLIEDEVAVAKDISLPQEQPTGGIQPSSSAPVSSWFGLWYPATPAETTEAIPVKTPDANKDTIMGDAPAPPASSAPTSSSWAFWSSDTKAKNVSEAIPEVGEVAISGEPSQNSPEPAKLSKPIEAKKKKSNKRLRNQSVDLDQPSQQTEPVTVADMPQSSTASKTQQPPNLLIPSVKQTFRLVENTSILQQIARLLLLSQQPPAKHVYLAKDTPVVKRALAIGIHGLFPAPLLRTVIGQPTGTSIKFANHAASAIRRWTDAHGYKDCEIERVALEGEGKIADRVDSLWKLLLNWIDHVRKADFILVACHSQGVPVAIMLVAKLIEFGVVSQGRIGICAMAGVSLGPFADYKSRFISGSAGEIFEFADPESVVSKRLEDSLRVAVKYGARITYVGSIDDQLVSMESAIFATASHPYIYRAVFVDGRIHAPDFLSHLVGFALKLRNLGVSDHGLIRELSAPLAGSLYTGEGHSRLYDDGKVYDLAIEHALETTSSSDLPLELKKYEIPNTSNPYVLPWIMRGLLEEEFVKTELNNETTELLKQFDDWRPSTKVLKDVKYRLEAVRSKL
ncbi:hypothetical protein HYALB_00008739 [Hymenoscyphus albidus]|uniref:YMC020W-like alpha/beta hydrolase domain-containing protein n=1 Tax=Hymenoscyphus albidus TaxID=595503 RepID=A0A9N9LQU9_9HELO|nr:hypothetical protein HYALB_00008739 [Hymenoscyphus albidus]